MALCSDISEFGVVVADYDLERVVFKCELFEFAHDAHATQRGVDHRGQALAAEVVDHPPGWVIPENARNLRLRGGARWIRTLGPARSAPTGPIFETFLSPPGKAMEVRKGRRSRRRTGAWREMSKSSVCLRGEGTGRHEVQPIEGSSESLAERARRLSRSQRQALKERWRILYDTEPG
jgi:hypothetical protein